MAIPFLNNIDLSDNQLLNAKLQVTSTAPTAAIGQIYYNSGDAVARYYNGSANPSGPWVNITDTSLTDGTFVSTTNTGGVVEKNYTVDLSATGTPDATKYLRGDNAWEAISAIPGTYTWSIQGDAGGPTAVASGDAIDFAGGTNVTTALSGTTLTINATDTNDNDYLTALSFNTSDGVLTATVQNQSDVTVDLDGRYLTGNETITLSGDVTGSGTTSIATTISAGAVDFAMLNPTDVITEAEGIENNDNDTTIPTSAAVKAYADSLIVGGLIYQGGYDAATNTPDLTTSPNSILKGWTYTVTANGTFFGEQLRVGDVLIAEINSPSNLTDWTRVQNNIDLASLTQVGIGNVNAEPAGNKDGLSVAYTSGTAAIGLDITNLPNLSVAITAADLASLEIPLYNGDTSASNEKIEVATLLSAASKTISYAVTITDTATISHGLASSDVMVQLYDITTGETVYADVDRISTAQVTITFAATPTNSVRVLVQKIG